MFPRKAGEGRTDSPKDDKLVPSPQPQGPSLFARSFVDKFNKRETTAIDLFKYGLSLVSSNPVSAEYCFQAILGQNPDDGHALYGMGCIWENTNASTALGYFSRAMISLPKEKYGQVYEKMGHAYLKLNDYKNAAAYYDVAIHLKANTVALHHQAGNSCFKNRQYLEAIIFYQHALELDKTDIDAWYGIAASCKEYARQDQAQAREYFELAQLYYREIKEILAYHERAYILFHELDRPGLALNVIDQVFQQAQTAITVELLERCQHLKCDILYALAKKEQELGNNPVALHYINECLEIRSGDREALELLKKILTNEQPERPEQYADQFFGRHYMSTEAHRMVGMLCEEGEKAFDEGDYETAQSRAQQVLRRTPNSGRAKQLRDDVANAKANPLVFQMLGKLCKEGEDALEDDDYETARALTWQAYDRFRNSRRVQRLFDDINDAEADALCEEGRRLLDEDKNTDEAREFAEHALELDAYHEGAETLLRDIKKSVSEEEKPIPVQQKKSPRGQTGHGFIEPPHPPAGPPPATVGPSATVSRLPTQQRSPRGHQGGYGLFIEPQRLKGPPPVRPSSTTTSGSATPSSTVSLPGSSSPTTGSSNTSVSR